MFGNKKPKIPRKIDSKRILASFDQNDTLNIIEFALFISWITQAKIRIIKNKGKKYLNILL